MEVFVDEEEIDAYLAEHPQPFNREAYLGAYADTHPEDTEPYTGYIKELVFISTEKYTTISFQKYTILIN